MTGAVPDRSDMAGAVSDRYDVAVVGAGPAGSSAAAALAAAGWRVALIERGPLPRHKVCGEFLSPEAQATLRTLGLHDELAAQAPRPLTGATLTGARGTALEMGLPGAAWGLSRFAMDAALAHAAAARGADLLTRTRAIRAEHDDHGTTLTVRDSAGERRLRARAVVLASGRNSPPALAPTAPTPSRDKLFVGLKSHMTGLTMPARVELYLFDGGYVGINPVETGAVNVCLLARYDAFARAGRAFEGMITAIGAQNPAFAERLRGGTPVPQTHATVAAVDPYRRATPTAGAPCVGDTATMIPPLCGDGMAMALRAAELGVPLVDEFLRGETTRDQWRQRHTRRWHQEFDRRLRVGRALQRLLDRPALATGLIAAGRTVPTMADYVVRSTRGSAG